jgi:hypothetical protein
VSWQLIKQIRSATDGRLVLPLGLSLKLGDVVSVGDNGNLTWEGHVDTLLGPTQVLQGRVGPPVNLFTTSDNGVRVSFRAAGHVSAIDPSIPNANAGVDIVFERAKSWVLGIVGRRIQQFAADSLRAAILDANRRGVWKEDWALINQVAHVDRMTLIASTTANTKVALGIGANVGPQTPFESTLTADVHIAFATQQLTQCIFVRPTVAFVGGLRVRDEWWRKRPSVYGVLSSKPTQLAMDAEPADREEVWEDCDSNVG